MSVPLQVACGLWLAIRLLKHNATFSDRFAEINLSYNISRLLTLHLKTVVQIV